MFNPQTQLQPNLASLGIITAVGAIKSVFASECDSDCDNECLSDCETDCIDDCDVESDCIACAG